MMNNIDEVTDKRLQALKKIEKDKIRFARAYNNKIKLKSFQINLRNDLQVGKNHIQL
jgi:hypothetical protein